MEHLQTYVVPSLKLPQVPVLRIDRFTYDGLGFVGFPERVFFDVRELWSPTDTDLLNDYDRLSFLQNWLYFAFAHEVFGHILPNNPTALVPSQLTSTVILNDNPTARWIDSKNIIIAATAWMALHELLNTD